MLLIWPSSIISPWSFGSLLPLLPLPLKYCQHLLSCVNGVGLNRDRCHNGAGNSTLWRPLTTFDQLLLLSSGFYPSSLLFSSLFFPCPNQFQPKSITRVGEWLYVDKRSLSFPLVRVTGYEITIWDPWIPLQLFLFLFFDVFLLFFVLFFSLESSPEYLGRESPSLTNS